MTTHCSSASFQRVFRSFVLSFVWCDHHMISECFFTIASMHGEFRVVAYSPGLLKPMKHCKWNSRVAKQRAYESKQLVLSSRTSNAMCRRRNTLILVRNKYYDSPVKPDCHSNSDDVYSQSGLSLKSSSQIIILSQRSAWLQESPTTSWVHSSWAK